MDKIKVLHIVATGTLSGAEKVVLDICTNLNRDRFEPVVVCAGEELKGYYANNEIEAHIIDISKLNPIEIRRLKNLIKEKNIDIVHGHDIKASISGYLASKRFKIPVISHMHASYYWMQKPSPLKLMDRYFRKKYSLSIAVSEMARNYYLTHNNTINPESIITLNNAFNFNELEKAKLQDSVNFKERLGIDRNKFIYGFLGRLIEIKGADLMIDSFNIVQKKKENTVLLIVGDGPEREKLEEKVRGYGISDKVIFTGYQKNVYDYMNIFDCFILPSITEGLPIAVLEAMAMKKTVISTPVAGLKDLMKDGYNGLILEERTEEALAEAMLTVYEKPELSRQMAENAYSFLYENYNINRYIERLENIYSRFVQK